MPESKRIKIVTETDGNPVAAGASPAEAAAADNSGEPYELTAEEERMREMENRLAAKEKECHETHDKLLRVSAEFENYRKRTAREMDDYRKYAVQSLLKEMLSAVDHVELAIQAAASNSAPDKNLTEGLSLTLKELLRIFEKFNVMPIEAVGKPFNPEFHEAILRDFRDVIPKLEKKLKKRGVPGVFLDLEPHVKGGGQFGGFSGPDGFGVALRALCRTLDYLDIGYHLRDFDDVKAARGF